MSTVQQHRPRLCFAVGTRAATLIALALGLLVGLAITTALSPDARGFGVGILYGLMLGVPAAAAVMLARVGVRRHFHPWLTSLVVITGAALVAALLFWLTQPTPAMLSVGAGTGALVAFVAVAIAVWPGTVSRD